MKIIFTNVQQIHLSRCGEKEEFLSTTSERYLKFKNTIYRDTASKSRATFEIPLRNAHILIVSPEPGVYEIEREWRKLFPSDVFASFSMFRIENSGERIEAFRLEGRRRNTCVVFRFELRGVVNKRYSREYTLSNIEIAVFWNMLIR